MRDTALPGARDVGRRGRRVGCAWAHDWRSIALAGWRGVFLAEGVLGTAAFLAVAMLVRERRPEPRPLDQRGAIIAAVGLVATVLSLTRGELDQPAVAPATTAALSVAALLARARSAPRTGVLKP